MERGKRPRDRDNGAFGGLGLGFGVTALSGIAFLLWTVLLLLACNKISWAQRLVSKVWGS